MNDQPSKNQEQNAAPDVVKSKIMFEPFFSRDNQDQGQFSNVFQSVVTVFNQFDWFLGQIINQFSTEQIDSHSSDIDSKIICFDSPLKLQSQNNHVDLEKQSRHFSNQKLVSQTNSQHGQNGSQSILRKNNQNSFIKREEILEQHFPISQIEGNKNQTNSWKNFIMNFSNFMSSNNSRIKQKFMEISEIEPSEYKFRKLVECLKKKIKKDKHTLLHLKSLLVYKDQHYTQFLTQMCSNFLEQYPSIVEKSTKMTQSRRNENLSIIPAVSNLLTLLRDPIFVKFRNTKQF